MPANERLHAVCDLGVDQSNGRKWRRRFLERLVPGLYAELRSGRPRSIEDEQVAALLKRTLIRKPKAGTHWTIREAAQASGSSKSTVHSSFRPLRSNPIAQGALPPSA